MTDRISRRGAGRGGAALPVLILAATAAAWLALASEKGPTEAREAQSPLAPLPRPPALDPAKVALGRALFHDPIMSSRQGLACSSCHDLATGGTVYLERSIGYEGKVHEFNVPTLFNVGNNYRLGWRGQFTSLTAKTEHILTDRYLMANDWAHLLPRLRASGL
jgi:cytochrome c peroxidase